MSTRTVTINDDERRLLVELLGAERDRVDGVEILTRPDSPAQRMAIADRERIEALRDKLR